MKTTLLAALALAAPALAQPVLIEARIGGSDISADGNTILGGYYNAETNLPEILKLTLGGDIFRIPIVPRDGGLTMSDDLSIVAYAGGNLENVNNALNSIAYSQPNQWETVSLGRTWSLATGDVNRGIHPNGNRCDYTINTAADLSGNGRYIVGGMWTGGLCGPFRAYINDTQTGQFTQLPFSFEGPPANTFADANRANAVNANGTVVVGYDNNNRPTGGRVRRPSVWKKNANNTWTQTILDRFGGEAYCVSADGTYVGGTDSTGVMVRWHFNGTTWDREAPAGGTGRVPTHMSADGNYMVGDIFIWSPDINDGVVIGLLDYAANLGSVFPDFQIFNPLGASVHGVSNDGTKVLVSGVDLRSPCLETFTGAVLDFAGRPCIPASLIGAPSSDTSVAPAPGYYAYGIIVNIFATGTWPLNYQWQKLDPATGTWNNMVDDEFCNTNYGGQNFDTKAVTTQQLRLGFLSNTWRGQYRCVVSNACGSFISPVSRITDCPADYDTSGGVDGDDVIAYFADWDQSRDEADFDNNGGVDGDDIIAFFARWDQSC